MMTSRLRLARISERNAMPISGRSPRKGTLSFVDGALFGDKDRRIISGVFIGDAAIRLHTTRRYGGGRSQNRIAAGRCQFQVFARDPGRDNRVD